MANIQNKHYTYRYYEVTKIFRDKLINNYNLSCGVKCRVIEDFEGENFCPVSYCAFCRRLHELMGRELSCRNLFSYAKNQAERFGGKYIFFCPIGLALWISPVYEEKISHKALVSQPVLLFPADDYVFYELSINMQLSEREIGALMPELRLVPVVTPEAAEAKSDILMYCAAYLSGQQNVRIYPELSRIANENYSVLSILDTLEVKNAEYPFEKERQLMEAVANHDKTQAQRLLNDILGYVFFGSSRRPVPKPGDTGFVIQFPAVQGSGGEAYRAESTQGAADADRLGIDRKGGVERFRNRSNDEIIKTRVQELIVLLSRAAVSAGADVEEIFFYNFQYISEIKNTDKVDEITVWLSEIMKRFTDTVFNFEKVKHADIMHRAINYIRENYADKITLEAVARHVNLSPTYFSKIFAQEMKLGFAQYLNKIRIEKSRLMLADKRLSLADIALANGFLDQSHFTKVFKRTAGITPKAYREKVIK